MEATAKKTRPEIVQLKMDEYAHHLRILPEMNGEPLFRKFKTHVIAGRVFNCLRDIEVRCPLCECYELFATTWEATACRPTSGRRQSTGTTSCTRPTT